MVQSFELETEKRSMSRYQTKKQLKPASDEEKENRVNKTPIKRIMIQTDGGENNSKQRK